MRTIFIVNPKAGKGKYADDVIERIKNVKKNNKEVELYITKAIGDAELFTKDFCEKNPNEKLRFIACGGDGTINEVLNGAIRNPNSEFGVVPIGNGNDFCRNFPKECVFTDIEAQIYSETVKCDAIKHIVETPDCTQERYCANMFNIGFDCNVADMTTSIRKIPLIRGSLAYFISIFVILIRKKGAELKIVLDDKEIFRGKLLLNSIANGSYCGGGIKSNPLASINDGMIDVNIVKNISRTKLIKLLPSYMKGTHMQLKDINEILISAKCKRMEVTALDSNMRLCTDGEISDAQKIIFESVHDAFDFVLPIPKEK